MRLRHLAPSGTPITLRDIGAWLASLPAADRRLEEFRAELCRQFRVRHCLFACSGRAAMHLLLRALRGLAGPGKTDVIVPAYTCYSVPAAAVRAGLRVRVADIDPATLSLRLDQLAQNDFSNVLAIISGNLYGIPNDLPAIAAIARANRVFFIDDAAQAMGASVGGQAAGTFGDAGLFSLDKGKNITSMQGGILVTDSDALASRLHVELERLPRPPACRNLVLAVQLLAYGLLLRPWLYWLPASIPFLKLGTTVYDTGYPVEPYSARLGTMGARLFRRLEALNHGRIAHAGAFREALDDLTTLQPIRILPDAQPVYLRYPFLADTPARRGRIVTTLQMAGLGATASYPASTLDIPELRPSLDLERSRGAMGRSVATRIVTLPTHSYVDARHVEHICSIIRDIAVER